MEEYVLFQSAGTGEWHVINKDICSEYNTWICKARLLSTTPAEFVKLLIDKYNCDYIKLRGKMLLFSWTKYNDANRFKLDLNRIARAKGLM